MNILVSCLILSVVLYLCIIKITNLKDRSWKTQFILLAVMFNVINSSF